MSLHTIYGVNGVGKDTVAAELATRHKSTVWTSESRLLMFILGIAASYDAREPVLRAQYRALENIPQTKMIDVQETEYRKMLEDLANRSGTILILSHLVFALYLDKQITYLTKREMPDWYIAANQTFAQLIAPPEVILERRIRDAAHRDRGIFSLNDVIEHQRLCDEKWEKLTHKAENRPCFTVVNLDLDQAVCELEGVIYDQT